MVAIHATVHPELCVELAEEALPKGVIVIDVPVSGGPEQSEEGTLLVMMGGETEVVERFRPVFDTFGTPVLHLGLVGAGQLAKLVNNTLLTANLGLAANAIEVGKRVGIDPDTLVQVITNGSGRSYGGGIFERNRLQPGTRARHVGLPGQRRAPAGGHGPGPRRRPDLHARGRGRGRPRRAAHHEGRRRGGCERGLS